MTTETQLAALREDILEILDGHFEDYTMPSPSGDVSMFYMASETIMTKVQAALVEPSYPKRRSKMPKSEEYDLDKLLTWDIDGHKEPVIFKPELKKALLAWHNKTAKAEMLGLVNSLPYATEQNEQTLIPNWITSHENRIGWNFAKQELRRQVVSRYGADKEEEK